MEKELNISEAQKSEARSRFKKWKNFLDKVGTKSKKGVLLFLSFCRKTKIFNATTNYRSTNWQRFQSAVTFADEKR